MITTLIWGVVNGSKVLVIASLGFAGLAQWWLAKELKLGWVARMWSAFMVIVGGHLATKMELGLVSMVLSTAMVSLIFPALLYVRRKREKGAILVMAFVIASAIFSGQGYMQVGMLMTAPALVFLLFDDALKLQKVWKEYAVAAVLGLLIAAPLIVPVIHFAPNLLKWKDPEFFAAQPLAYAPLNLVIDDLEFYKTHILSKLPFPSVYAVFIGWVPVIFALIGLSLASRARKKRNIYFLAASVGLVFLFVSPPILKWLVTYFSAIAGLRFSPYILGMVIPPILGLSAFGLDEILKLDWPKLSIKGKAKTKFPELNLGLQWLLIIPLILSVRQSSDFARIFLYTVPMPDNVISLLDELKTPDLQWVATPHGEHFWVEIAVRQELKLSPGIMPWIWKGNKSPVPLIDTTRDELPKDYAPESFIAEVDGIKIFTNEGNEYAAVETPVGLEPCFATGSGGWIDVTCDLNSSGSLIVKEHMWSGWKAWRDGIPVELLGFNWLEVQALAGEHTYTFRYQPWDVTLGIGLFALGLILGVGYWASDIIKVNGGISETSKKTPAG
jgi:hypothetical protein